MLKVKKKKKKMLVLNLVQTVCKGYQQTTKVAAFKERVKVDYNLNVTFLFGMKIFKA